MRKESRWSTLYCNKSQVPSRMFDSRDAVLQNEMAVGEEAMTGLKPHNTVSRAPTSRRSVQQSYKQPSSLAFI